MSVSDSSLLENRSSNPVSVDTRPASSFPPCGNREGGGGAGEGTY